MTRPHRYMTPEQRFEASYEPVPEAGCWLWVQTTVKGYGQFMVDGLRVLAHRYSLESRLGRGLDEAMQACHKCDVPSCVNPDHLFEGTQQENADDMVSKGRQAKGDHVIDRCQGERHHSAKLTPENAAFIRASALRPSELARQFGIAIGSVRKIQLGKTWKSLA